MRHLLHFIFVFLIALWIMQPQQVQAQIQDQDPDIMPQIWSVNIEGNNEFSDIVLKRQISAESPSFLGKLKFWDREGFEFNETEIKKDVVRLRNFYNRRGFVNVEINYQVREGNKEWKRRVTFNIEENMPVRIRTLSFEFEGDSKNIEEVWQNRAFQRAQERHAYQEGNRYERIKETEVIGNFTDVFKNLGYAYANVNIAAYVDTSKLAASIDIKSDLGPKTFIDSVNVVGTETISKEYILRESGIEHGNQYSLQKLQDAQRELFNHHLFRFATISIPEQPKDSTLTLLMRLREREKRSVEIQGGFGTEEKLRGLVSWTNRNVNNYGHRFTITGRASFIEQFVSFDYLFPYVYNTKSSVVIEPFGQHLLQENFELLRAGVINSLIYRYNENLTSSAAYEYTKNQELSRQFDASLPDTTLEYDLSSFRISAHYGQGYGRQQAGWVIQPSAEASGVFGLATFRFQKLSADVRRFTRLGSSTMLAKRVQAGGLFNAPTDSLPNNIRFYLGGTNSVRGWYRQDLGPKRARTDSADFVRYVPRGGRAMFSFNVEIRQDLNFLIDGLGMAGFLDGGQVWETWRELDGRPLQFGIGGGFRYQSPIGPVRIDIGYKLNPTEADLNRYRERDFGSAWDRIGIHFSIGQAF